jgi:hypothetical protein
MADGGIGDQALEVVLADGGKGGEHHRGNREEDDDLLPVAVTGSKLTVTTRMKSAIAATLGAEAKKAVTGVGAPS